MSREREREVGQTLHLGRKNKVWEAWLGSSRWAKDVRFSLMVSQA